MSFIIYRILSKFLYDTHTTEAAGYPYRDTDLVLEFVSTY